ncbi:MAG: hypothetical protein L3J76_05280, partial [Candidatus Hydrothermae bacterium]|nr:hypothetical protein [Candidatus Hydrothermae bacterium]
MALVQENPKLPMLDRERNDWRRFYRHIDMNPPLKTDIQTAILKTMQTYDSSIRENRFVTGGAIEVILGSALRVANIHIVHKGPQQSRLDLQYIDDPSQGFSVKSMLKPSNSGTRLINVMGHTPSVDMWDHAVIFVLPTGLVYADPFLDWWK